MKKYQASELPERFREFLYLCPKAHSYEAYWYSGYNLTIKDWIDWIGIAYFDRHGPQEVKEEILLHLLSEDG